MQKLLGALIILLVLTGCTNEKEIQEEKAEIQEQPKPQPIESISIEEKVQLPSFESIAHPKISLNDGVGFDSFYQEVCWNDCTEEDKLNGRFNKNIKDKIGDKFNVKWDHMIPAPNRVEVRVYTTDFNQVGETEMLPDEQKNFQLVVTDIAYDKIYEVLFVWEDGTAIGKSRLVFEVQK